MEEKMDISKPSIKIKSEFDSTKPVFSEVDMSTMKSQVWKHFLRDKKRGLAKCKLCDSVLKADQSTSVLNKHLKIHKIDVKSVEKLEEPPSKKGKIDSFFVPKSKPPELQELVAKISSVDGISFAALAKSESLQFVFQKAGYKMSKSHSELRNLAMNQYQSIKEKIKSEIAEAKESGIRLSITNDESTSTRNRRFMNINCHFETMYKSLGMARVYGLLPGQKCADLVMKRLEDYGIQLYMVVEFTTDAARVKVIHQECFTHGIHLAGM